MGSVERNPPGTRETFSIYCVILSESCVIKKVLLMDDICQRFEITGKACEINLTKCHSYGLLFPVVGLATYCMLHIQKKIPPLFGILLFPFWIQAKTYKTKDPEIEENK